MTNHQTTRRKQYEQGLCVERKKNPENLRGRSIRSDLVHLRGGYAEREAAIGALKAHLEDSLPELQKLVPGASVQSLLESGENNDYGWRYMEYDEVSETSPDVAEWALTSEDAAMFYGPHEFILPYFIVQLLDIQ